MWTCESEIDKGSESHSPFRIEQHRRKTLSKELKKKDRAKIWAEICNTCLWMFRFNIHIWIYRLNGWSKKVALTMVLSCELVLLRLMHHDVENGKPCMSIDGDIVVVSALRFGIPCVVLVPPFPPPFVADSTVGTLNLLRVRIIGIGIPLQGITHGRWVSRPVHFLLEASTNPFIHLPWPCEPPGLGLFPQLQGPRFIIISFISLGRIQLELIKLEINFSIRIYLEDIRSFWIELEVNSRISLIRLFGLIRLIRNIKNWF